MKKSTKVITMIMAIGAIATGQLFNSKTSTQVAADSDDWRTVEVGSFSKIKLNLKEADVSIHAGSKYQVKFDDDDHALHASVTKGQLNVSQKGGDDDDADISITVPKSKLTKISSTSSDGDIELKNLKLSSLYIKNTGGDVEFKNVSASSAKIALKEGDLDVSKGALKLIAQLTEGDAEFSGTKFTGNSTLTLKEGDVDIKHAPSVSYTASTPEGDIKYHGSNKGKHFSKTVSGQPLVKITTKEGDVEIS
ncbi:DUF4097 family beta strand repeat-containing protein [Lactobacillus sp. ESL0680]|uniref:DUF4097 family beta strand repeat-containing protein n=1 Tax=Lactobacillus sp. ESL0680 TaxID=2983210 RepID=UPI0023F6F681|nr:DUF4097 family beta strand repeat-containing protein [Lactobacillus sp. ESL0680]WEV38530.1 DUF4097 family beta strand repeat-containing protein [Lactobacillus sp. ESL0680]